VKTCLLLFWIVAWNFRKFYNLVWSHLSNKCKSYGRKRKQKRENESEQKNRKRKQPTWAVPMPGAQVTRTRSRPNQPPLPFPLFLSLPDGTHLSARSSPTVSPPSPVTSPELLPRHHRDLIVHQDPSIKGPDTPSLTSLLSARDCAPRLLEFLAGAPPVTLQILVDSGEEGSPRPLPPAPFSSF
jgi:hypothetical protein